MGLDMYLSAKINVYGSEWAAPEQKALHAKLDKALSKVLPKISDNLDTIEVTREVAYWRKANQVHAWFVREVQGGKDDCRPYYVERKQLQELRDICQRVIDGSTLVSAEIENGYSFSNGVRTPILERGLKITNPELAASLLPTAEGFFGGTSYDQYYMQDLESTVEQLDKALKLPENVYFEYQSSW